MNMKIFHASEDLIQKIAVGMYFMPMAQQNTGYGLIATSGMILPNGVMLKFEAFAYDEVEKAMDIINVSFQFVPDVSLVQSKQTGRVHLCKVDPSNKEYSIGDLDLNRFTTSITNIHNDKVPNLEFTPENDSDGNDDTQPESYESDDNQNDEVDAYDVPEEITQDEYEEEEIDASHMSKDELSSRLNEVVNNRTSRSSDSNHKVYLRNNESDSSGVTIGENLSEETVSKLATIGDDSKSNSNNRNGSRNERNNQNGNRNSNNNKKFKGGNNSQHQQNHKNDQDRHNNNQQQRNQKPSKSVPLPKPPKQPKREDIYNDARMRMISKARSGSR